MVSVEVAPDRKTCKAYISTFGDAAAQDGLKAALRSASGFIRHALSQDLNLRLTPEIRFILDQSIEYGVEMSKRIDDVMEEQERHAALRDEEEQDPAGSGEAPEAPSREAEEA